MASHRRILQLANNYFSRNCFPSQK